MTEFQKSIEDLKKILESRPFKFELLIAFWVALHLEKLEFAKFIHEQDPLLEKVLGNLRKLGRGFLIEEMERKEMEKQKKELEESLSKSKKT
jgi:hypothetical protein